MKKMMNWLRNSGISKILTAVVAGLLLFVTTACNTPSVLAKTSDQIREEVPSTGVNSRFQGGMNDYSDVDPRKDTKAAKVQAKGLIDNAKSNVIDMTDDVGTNTQRTLDKKGENLDQFGQNLKRSADKAGDKTQNSAQDFAQGAKRGAENVKENTQNATKGLVDNSKQSNDKATRDSGYTANNNATKGLGDNSKQSNEKVRKNSENTPNNVVDGSQRAAGRSGDYLKSQGDRGSNRDTRVMEGYRDRASE